LIAAANHGRYRPHHVEPRKAPRYSIAIDGGRCEVRIGIPEPAMTDFWLSCGHHLTDRDGGGGLIVTDQLLKVYLARPELVPPPEACDAERALHAALLADPRRVVPPAEIAAISDQDARENWELMIGFRDRLSQHRTLEAAYLDMARRGVGRTPPIFLNQLVHMILRNILDGCEDAFMLRAAELMFRPQRLTLHEGSLIAADDETLAGIGTAPLSPLVSMLGPPAAAEVDVLTDENAPTYWKRSDLFDLALDLTAGRRGLTALGEVMMNWVRHMLAVDVRVELLLEMRDVSFDWYLGLDAAGTRIGNSLWNGEDLSETARASVVGLFELRFRDVHASRCGAEPVYLILAMTPDKILHMKPQNLLAGLPINRLELVS
jgi:hypothetical protein